MSAASTRRSAGTGRPPRARGPPPRWTRAVMRRAGGEVRAAVEQEAHRVHEAGAPASTDRGAARGAGAISRRGPPRGSPGRRSMRGRAPSWSSDPCAVPTAKMPTPRGGRRGEARRHVAVDPRSTVRSTSRRESLRRATTCTTPSPVAASEARLGFTTTVERRRRRPSSGMRRSSEPGAALLVVRISASSTAALAPRRLPLRVRGRRPRGRRSDPDGRTAPVRQPRAPAPRRLAQGRVVRATRARRRCAELPASASAAASAESSPQPAMIDRPLVDEPWRRASTARHAVSRASSRAGSAACWPRSPGPARPRRQRPRSRA